MSVPVCKCGHDAFSHGSENPHDCDWFDCECLAFNAAGECHPEHCHCARNFALLQAAAMISCHPDENGEFPLPEAAVMLAESLLSIIERRQKEGK
jgi:hypothetical protein